LEDAVGAPNPLGRPDSVDEVGGVTGENGSAKEAKLALRPSLAPSVAEVGLPVDESWSLPSDFWCFRGAARGAIPDTEDDPGIDKRLTVEEDAWDEDEARTEDGRREEKLVGETRDERESFLDKER
jgi:hypothetical protein